MNSNAKCLNETGGQELPACAGDWHALYARHQHEKVVAQHLERIGLPVFLPLYREVHQWSDRSRKVSLPLFPGYVFFAGGLDRRLQILNTPGVFSQVVAAGNVAVIPHAELEAVRRVVAGSHPVKPHPYLRSGVRVRVRSGPLAGIEGFVTRRKDSFRIVLSVDTLCRSVAVEVDEAMVEALPGAYVSAPVERVS